MAETKRLRGERKLLAPIIIHNENKSERRGGEGKLERPTFKDERERERRNNEQIFSRGIDFASSPQVLKFYDRVLNESKWHGKPQEGKYIIYTRDSQKADEIHHDVRERE